MAVTITTILGTDVVGDSRAVINANFTNLKNAVDPLVSNGVKVLLSITGFTGGGSANIDGIATASYPKPSLFTFVINGQMANYVLQTSSTTADGFLVIQPVDNSALRFISV